MAWLDDHPPRRSQSRHPRREDPSGVIVVHTAESTPDTVATDGGAEAVANFIRNRTDAGSYHDLCDSDSIINLVDYGDEAFHDGTGSNRHSYGVSGATRADFWPWAPQAWRDGCIEQMARAAAGYSFWVHARYGVVIPARRITRAESERRVPGFISHGQRDPGRRSDPGQEFPWDQFLAFYEAFRFGGAIPTPTPETEDDVKLKLIACTHDSAGKLKNAWFKTNGVWRSWVPTEGHAKKLVELGLLEAATPTLVGPDFLRELIPYVPSDNDPGADRLHHDDL